jgi:glyoxylase-like metal-dependent hydrolase (beta-lactamase superfamily II)
MEKVAPNVFTETKIRGCNPSIVFTSEGSVFIDNAQLLTKLLEMIEFAKKRGPIRYMINTENHIDHIFGNHWFAGVCPVVGHETLKDDFFKVPGDLGGYDYSVDVLTRQDPEGLPLMPSRDKYIVNTPQITFSDKMTLEVGDHHFLLYHTGGHCKSQIAVYVPEERTVFVGDTVFQGCQIWLHSVPGHGPVITKKELIQQKEFIYDWISAVAHGISKGWSEEECVASISFADRCPVDIGQPEMMEYIQTNNVRKCYHYLTGV